MTSKLTRNILQLVCLTIALSAATAGAASAGPVVKWRGDGAYIAVSGTDASGCLWSYLYAGRAGTKAAPETWLYYDIYNSCTGEWIAYGGGRIANTTLKVTKKGATLIVTSSASADFSTEGLTGSIQLTLSADGVSSYTFAGHSRSEYAGHVYQSHGSWSSQSASVSGSLLGFATGNMQGSFGEGRDKYMEFERGAK